MKLLILESCNYTDYPLGGQLTFAKYLIRAFGEDAKLVGVSTDKNVPRGVWTKREIDGVVYDYFSFNEIMELFKKPLIPARISAFVRLKPYMHKVLEQVDYDMIFVQAPEMLFCLPDKYLAKTFVVMPGVENPLSIARYPLARYFQRWYDYFFMRKIAKVPFIFASADERKLAEFVARSRGLLSRDRIVKYPTRYESAVYYVSDRLKERRDLQLSMDARVFVTVGRLSWFKGWKLMIDSFELYHQKDPHSYFYFLGDGEDRKAIETYIHERQLEPYVKLLGSQPAEQVAAYLNAADVFVMGSFKEGWSTTLVEACACAVPCVVTDFSSADDMVREGENGYVVKQRDPVAFAARMAEAVAMPRERVIAFDEQYKELAVSKMRQSIESILVNNF